MSLILSFSRVVAPSLTISNFAGNGTKGYSGDGGLATEAQLNFPTGISRGRDGALYICDTGNHRVRKVARDGIITTIAGTGVGGWSGDGGTAIAAKLNEPYEVHLIPLETFSGLSGSITLFESSIPKPALSAPSQAVELLAFPVMADLPFAPD